MEEGLGKEVICTDEGGKSMLHELVGVGSGIAFTVRSQTYTPRSVHEFAYESNKSYELVDLFTLDFCLLSP